ncbi:uncharacterized protein VTP21DRAFT_4406 [Calcarisporiella thermophila]|uniref:uncharacterized protein n=1 Tax=Calcarisporiella thermophila TaxID=911321 RepID=UPI003743D8BE
MRSLSSLAVICVAALSAFVSAEPMVPKSGAGIITKCSVPGTFAITFDDGPSEFSAGLLEYLNSNNLTATFFVNGNNYGNILDYADHVRNVFHSGHLIASHTYSHADLSTLSAEGIKKEMTQLEDALVEIIGVKPKYMRPPYGNVNDNTVKTLNSLGYTVVNWDVDSNDWDVKNFEKEKENYKQALKGANPKSDGHISLQHDTSEITTKQLGPWAFQYAKQLGYKTVTVAECLGENDPKQWYRK